MKEWHWLLHPRKSTDNGACAPILVNISSLKECIVHGVVLDINDRGYAPGQVVELDASDANVLV